MAKRKRSTQETAPGPLDAKKKQKTSDRAPVAASIQPSLDASPFVDNPRGEELKREVNLYSILSSENEEERLNAAAAIISGLLKEDGVDESTLQRHLERRLFRGLASGRKGARIGYALVLAEILGQLFGPKDLSTKKYTGLTFDTVLGFLVAKTKPDGDLSGQEEKDHSLGLLFGLQSFVRAKILFGDDEDKWNTVLHKLLKLSEKKPWIREECGWVIAEALGQMNQKQAEGTLNTLLEAGLALSPEGVGIWLMARSQYPDMKFPSKPWGHSGNPLEHLKSLGKALKESSSGDDAAKTQQVKQTGNWNPKLHFVWNVILGHYITAIKDKTEGVRLEFENFWKVAVDENLFSASASRERKYWGFVLFQKIIEQSLDFFKVLPSIFSHNLVRCMINHAKDEDRFLNRSADKSLKCMVKAVEANPSLLPIILPSLISGYGTYNFDRETKTKTIEQLLRNINESNAAKVLKVLVEPAVIIKGDDKEAEKEGEARRQILADHLLDIIRTSSNAANNTTYSLDWISETALPTLATCAYSNNKNYQPPISNKTRELYRNRLMSAFVPLLSDLKGYKFPCNLLFLISPDAVAMDEGIAEARDGAISTLKKILKKAKKEEGQSKVPLQALALLYSLVIFQLYNGESEALSILDELKLCYDKLIRHKDTEDLDVDASEILVELLLSFISKPSALFRKVSHHVFSAFMPDMTAGGLELMTDVLQSDESLRGQQELFDQEPEDLDEMDEDGEDEEMDSDVEVIDMNGEEGHLNGHLADEDASDASDEQEDEDKEDDEEENDAAKQLDDALALALGSHRLDQDADAESDSDADMTDSEMMALDSKLVEIFSARKKEPNKKQEQKDAKETMINFKSRVLDLLAIYVKKQASNPLAFGLILPLLLTIRTTKTKQLSEKAHGIITAFAKALKSTKKEDSPVVKTSTQLKLLKAIHLEAAQDPSHAFAKAASTSSLMIASNLVRADRAIMKKISKIYHETQDAWMEGESEKMQITFFSEFLNWCQSHAKNAQS